jgi:hypothetical protein
MNNEKAYVWLDVIKNKLIDDLAPDREIEVIEYCKSLIREQITGYAEEESEYIDLIVNGYPAKYYINRTVLGL